MQGDTDTCGHPTADGTPCQNPASDGDSCWLDAHGGSAEPSGRDREPPTREQQEQIAGVIESGGSLREAARKAGVHREQINRWMEYGEEETAGPFQEFRDRLTRAKGEGEGQYRKALIRIAEENGDTATLMAMLKQRYPEAWQDVNRGEQAGTTVEVESEVVTVDAATDE
jgi:transposase-like protein